MTGLLICAAVVAVGGWISSASFGSAIRSDDDEAACIWGCVSLALIAVALWLAYAAGGA